MHLTPIATLEQKDEFRAAFEKYGSLCSLHVQGVPPVNILPESSSAFVNFARLHDANSARKGLQGKLVGGAGPLQINASDMMQVRGRAHDGAREEAG